MKLGELSINRIILFALLILVTGMATGCATTRNEASFTGSPGQVLVQETTGTVEVSLASDSEFQPAQRDQKVLVGQSIRTGNDSTADLFIPNVGTMRLTPSSRVLVKSLLVDKSKSPPLVNAEFELSEGRIQGNTLKMSPDSSVLVITPKGRYQIK